MIFDATLGPAATPPTITTFNFAAIAFAPGSVAVSGAGAAGISAVIRAPPKSDRSAQTRPPARFTIACTNVSPRPTPGAVEPEAFSVRTNGRNTASRSASGIPIPLSSTASRTRLPSALTDTPART